MIVSVAVLKAAGTTTANFHSIHGISDFWKFSHHQPQAERNFVGTGKPGIFAQFLACTASKCKKAGLACADKIVGQPGVGGEKTSKNPGFCGLNDS